jgi:hypothetical protein
VGDQDSGIRGWGYSCAIEGWAGGDAYIATKLVGESGKVIIESMLILFGIGIKAAA